MTYDIHRVRRASVYLIVYGNFRIPSHVPCPALSKSRRHFPLRNQVFSSWKKEGEISYHSRPRINNFRCVKLLLATEASAGNNSFILFFQDRTLQPFQEDNISYFYKRDGKGVR